MSNLLDGFLDPYMPLFDFLLAPDVASAARLVNHAYGSNQRFLENSPETRNAFGSQFEYECYLKILYATKSGTNDLDDRISTPELVFDGAIPINKCVSAAILPNRLIDDADTGLALKNLGIEVLDYPWVSGNRPGEMHFLIRQLVQQVYENRKW